MKLIINKLQEKKLKNKCFRMFIQEICKTIINKYRFKIKMREIF